MASIRYKNQSEYAFLHWMNNYPESFHPLDMKRFYVFAKSVARYRSKKWRDYSYFEKRILKHTPHFSRENITFFWEKLEELISFYRLAPIPTIRSENFSSDNKFRTGCYQRGVIDGKFYEVEISEDEYIAGGVTNNIVRRRIAIRGLS
jgi:hypothetical protein